MKVFNAERATSRALFENKIERFDLIRSTNIFRRLTSKNVEKISNNVEKTSKNVEKNRSKIEKNRSKFDDHFVEDEAYKKIVLEMDTQLLGDLECLPGIQM